MYEPKPLFTERMKKLITDEKDLKSFFDIAKIQPQDIIRCNTLKITPEKLKKNLEQRGWKMSQPYSKHPEIMIIENELSPGELGTTEEHLLGYYYVQEISSMMSAFALMPEEDEIVLDLCAAPGSKTTQISAMMNNKGTVIANDKELGRIKILSSNVERCGLSNAVITRNDAVQLCHKLKKINFNFDKILLDAPCSGEGTLRTSNKTFLIWNIRMIEKLSRMQKKMIANAIPLLKKNGVLIYSTCTHSPEENEEVINFALENFDVELQEIQIPLKSRDGVKEWNNIKFHKDIAKCRRIYPQDNNTEGFFLAKLRKVR
jgi:NOL1/NOP2/sun family putative RNA methylase